ncbi:hypothetical protein P43SY_011650 [Pythium insidiosum]|uniref:No apical meristem-associated C-terminal domain-containing protein n=1 Tax=Pythium insidiosum TaxID=114742 RepID=A0AAD5Q5B5_PYTIN|nr:hypothetical protein P43SY_011650 [Pythium insidiosum]
MNSTASEDASPRLDETRTSPSDKVLTIRGGRQAGQPNFKPDEDVALAKAYLESTTDPVKSTDQSGTAFWSSVHVRFMKLSLGSTRTPISLSNRWNNVLNKSLAKWVGHLTTALREYHSGWQYGDYLNRAKAEYADSGQKFKFIDVYNVVKDIPRYAVAESAIDSRVKSALGLDVVETDCGGSGAPMITFARRPEQGRKAAKRARHESGEGDAETDKELVTLKRIAEASEERNRLQKEQLKIEKTNSQIAFFKLNPNSDAAKRFFELQAEAFLQELEASQLGKHPRQTDD